jgi:molybdenum cofactor cytidylyltransferase
MQTRQPVAAVVLAAGEGRRFGGRKQLATLDGRTLLEHVLELAASGGLRPAIAVVPVWLTRPAANDDGEALRWVRNPYPERGMSHSLRLGFGALPETVEAAIILLGDQPRIPVTHLHALLAARGHRPIIATSVGGRLMPPVLVEREAFGVVEEPRGDIGLRELLEQPRGDVEAVRLTDELPDVDTKADLERLRGA